MTFMTTSMQSHMTIAIALAALLVTPFLVSAQEISNPDEEELTAGADLEQVITETTYKSATLLKAKKAFSGWPAKWQLEDGVLVMPGDRVVPDGAPSAFLKAKKAFDETDGDLEFVMPGDNVSEVDPDNPELAQ